MEKFRVSLQFRKVKAIDKEGYIFLRVKLAKIPNPILESTGFKIPGKYWDADKQTIKPNLPSGFIKYSVHQANEMMSLRLTKVELILKQEKDLSKMNVERILRGGNTSTGSFTRFFYNFIEAMKIQDKQGNTEVTPGYIYQWEAVYNKIITEMGEDIAFEHITVEWLEIFERSMAKDLSLTTLHVKFKKLRGVINAAVDRGFIEKKYIMGYKWPAYKEPERPYLTLNEVDAIADKIYAGHWDNDLMLRKVASYFIVECLSGIRFSDWARFKVETLIKNNAFKVRAKKNGQPSYLYLEHWPRLRRILDYIRENEIVFDLTEQSTNRMLKIIGQDAKLRIPLTTHIGRHTCATMLGELGYSDSEGSEILGISPTTFAKYRKMTRQGSKMAQARHGGL